MTDLISTAEMATLSGVSDMNIRRWIARGRITPCAFRQRGSQQTAMFDPNRVDEIRSLYRPKAAPKPKTPQREKPTSGQLAAWLRAGDRSTFAQIPGK